MNILLHWIFFLIFISGISLISSLQQDLLYTNLWVIELSENGEQEAKDIAKDAGLIYHGSVGSLAGLYILKEQENNQTSSRRLRRDVEHLYKTLSQYKNVRFIEPQVELKRTKRQSFNDPWYGYQWNLHSNNDDTCNFDINVRNVWKRGITGRGVVVTVVDDGLEHRHSDIKFNYDEKASYDYTDNDADPTPQETIQNYNKHGTRCAGQIAATANNGVCGIGVAYDARLGGIRMFDGPIIDSIEAASFSHNPQYIDIYSVSWGPDDDGKTVDGPRTLGQRAIREGARIGRGGLGSVYVWATGNGGRNSDHCACDGFVNMVETIAISAIDYCNRIPFYTEACPGVFAVTYSSGPSTVTSRMITTTDLKGKCTNMHSGTSAAAPVAAGIMALALQVNRNLTWRDLQHLIVRSSVKINPDHSSWIRNGNGLLVSDYFGFGSLDSDKLVQMAVHPEWKTSPVQRFCHSGKMIVNKGVHSITPIILSYDSLACNNSKANRIQKLEHVILKIDIVSWPRGGLEIKLISPSGTVSPMLNQRKKDFSSNRFDSWPFLSVFFWDENPVGVWKLEVTQKYSKAVIGTLKWWSIEFYGTSGSKEPPGPIFTTTRKTTKTVTDEDLETSNSKLSPSTIVAILAGVVAILLIVAVVLMKVSQLNAVSVQDNNTVVHRFSQNAF